jgi:hypothetical protein
MARTPKKATFHGVPSDKIAEAQTRYDNIYVKLFRRVSGGKLSALGPKHMTPQELGQIEEYLRDLAGGGKFRVEPRNPDNLLEYADPIPPFEVEIEGHPKPATPNEHGLKGIGGGINAMEGPQQMNWNPGQVPNPANPLAQPNVPYANMPDWMRALPPAMGASFAAQQNPNYVLQQLGEQPTGGPQHAAPAAMYASDQLGVQQLNYTREQLTKERTERDADRKEWERRFELMQGNINESKEDARAAREKGERDKLEAKLEAMQAAKPAIDPAVWVGLATAMAPVLSAMVGSNQAKAATQQEQATKAIELQMTGMNTLMQASGKKGGELDGLLKTMVGLAPIIGPVLAKFADNKSPGAQADLYSTLAENNLTTLTTMGQFLQAMQESQGNDPWWRPMIESAIESVQTVGAQMAVQAGATSPAVQQAAQRAGEPGAAQAGMSRGQTTTSVIVNNPQFPAALKTGEWFKLIAAMHDEVDPDQVSHHVAQHIVNLANKEQLPDLIDNIFEKPEEVLNMLISPMPIAQQNPAYVEKVVRLTAHALRNAVEADGAETAQVVDAPGESVEVPVEGVPSAAAGNGSASAAGRGAVPFNINVPREPVPAPA